MMPANATENYLRQLFETKFDSHISSLKIQPVTGGSINNADKITINGSLHFFLKSNSISTFPGLFNSERNSLEFLGKQNVIAIPVIIDCTETGTQQFLLLEWIEPGNKTIQFWKTFGAQLAQLHRISSEKFGFAEDNYIGSLPQHNTYTNNWIGFFINQRLQPQVKMALEKKLLPARTDFAFGKLYKRMDTIFNTEEPSLLHGDLWSGNFLCDKNERPVLVDPAVYFGHRSMDLAMTTLFGGFDKLFYESYHYHFPLPPGYKQQWEICNLYPLLVHLNLFGISYLQDIELILRKFSG